MAREQAVVGIHAEFVTPGHRLGDEVAAHLPGDRGGDRFGEEEPDVSTVPRPRALDRGGKTHLPARGNERPHVFRPAALVEVDRQEPAGLVLEELAYAANELVGAGGRVSGLAGLLAHETRREDVSATAEELAKESDFLLGAL